jgi:glutamine synthetase
MARTALRRPPATAPGASARDVLGLVSKSGIKVIDLKFTDLLGTWQHFSISNTELNEELFVNGIGFDGSSIRGFQQIHESDMLVVPDPATAIVDPCLQVPTLSIVCNIVDPVTREPYTRDPRFVAQKAEAYLKKTGIADVSYWGPEIEYFTFDHVAFDQTSNRAFYEIDSDNGIWNSGRARNGTPNLGYRPRTKEGYFPCPPTDVFQDLRSKTFLKLMEAGIQMEVHHAEVSTAGQAEIDMKYKPLTQMADQVLLAKYILRNVAHQNGKTVTFMPKPLFGDNGTGMHVHSSIWKNGRTLMHDAGGYGQISETCRHYIGGLLKHSPAIMAFAAPTTNSYRRLVPGFEAPVNLVYSARNRSAACRIPMFQKSPASKRVEYRPPDATANPYLLFPAMLLAGLDGIQNKIDPGEPLDKDIYGLDAAEGSKIPQVPGSLPEALDALERDHAFLLRGDVFTKDLIDTWISYKRSKEVDAVRLRPHPYEFFLYFDA